jgi:CSLREA domain-containing protein
MTRFAHAFTSGRSRMLVALSLCMLAAPLPAASLPAKTANARAAIATPAPGSNPTVSTTATASTRTVNSTADTDDGTCDATDCTLREALTAAQAGDTIAFSSLFNTPQVIHLGGALPAIAVNLTLTGPGASRLTVQRSQFDYEYTLLVVNSGVTATVTGITLAGGHGFSGGAIDNEGNLTLRDSALSGNFGLYGGGIYSNGQLLIERSTINGNSAGDGGGVYVASPGVATLTNLTVSGNNAAFGTGGIAVTGKGGASATVTMTNATIAFNRGATEDSLAPWDSDDASPAVIQLRNTLITNNAFVGFFELNIHVYGVNASVISLGNNLIDFDGSGTINAAGDVTNVDPMLAPLYRSGATATHVLRLGSPALNAGTSTGAPSTDQRGVPRPQGGVVDIGAVEMRPLVVTSTADPGDGVCDASCTLRDALLAANADGAGTDDIQFADSPFAEGAQTINLTAALPNITSNLTVVGPGANWLTLRRDTGGDYGVLVVNPGVTVFMSGVTVANGKTGFGGGINNFGSLTLLQCAVRGNTATTNAGGIQNNGILALIESTISGNSANYDGALLNYQPGTATVINSTISGNTATVNFGGIANTNFGGVVPNLALFNTTIVNNHGGVAGGIATVDQGGVAITTFENSIIANNSLPNFGASGVNAFMTSLSGNVISDSGSGFAYEYDLANTQPMLSVLGYFGGPTQTHIPLPGSPAIGIDYFDLPSTDQRGLPRANPGSAGSVERQFDEDEIFSTGFE